VRNDSFGKDALRPVMALRQGSVRPKNAEKVPYFSGFYGVGSNEPNDEPSGFTHRGIVYLYQRHCDYAGRYGSNDTNCYRTFILFPTKIPWYKAKSEVSGFKWEPADLAFFVYWIFGQLLPPGKV